MNKKKTKLHIMIITLGNQNKNDIGLRFTTQTRINYEQKNEKQTFFIKKRQKHWKSVTIFLSYIALDKTSR